MLRNLSYWWSHHIIAVDRQIPRQLAARFLSLHFNGHFPGEPQPVFIEAKDDGSHGDNWATGAISRAKYSQIVTTSFSVGSNPIERVESFSHLGHGHIITSSLSDKDDVRFRRNCFIG